MGLQMKHKTCIGLSHQAAVINKKSPKPEKKDIVGKAVLHNYAPVTDSLWFSFGAYDKNIFTPVIREQVRKAHVPKTTASFYRLPACLW